MSSVQVSDADMQDPELVAELAALAGEMGGSAPAPAPVPAMASAQDAVGSAKCGRCGERVTAVEHALGECGSCDNGRTDGCSKRARLAAGGHSGGLGVGAAQTVGGLLLANLPTALSMSAASGLAQGGSVSVASGGGVMEAADADAVLLDADLAGR